MLCYVPEWALYVSITFRQKDSKYGELGAETSKMNLQTNSMWHTGNSQILWHIFTVCMANSNFVERVFVSLPRRRHGAGRFVLLTSEYILRRRGIASVWLFIDSYWMNSKWTAMHYELPARYRNHHLLTPGFCNVIDDYENNTLEN